MIDKAGARRADRTPGTDHPCGAGPWLPSSRSDCRRHPDSGDQASASARHGVADSLPGRRKGTRKRVSPPSSDVTPGNSCTGAEHRRQRLCRGLGGLSLCSPFSLGFSPASCLSQRRNALGNCWHGNRIPCHRFYTIGGLLSVVPFHRRHWKDQAGPTPQIHPQTHGRRIGHTGATGPQTRPGARAWLSNHRFGDSCRQCGPARLRSVIAGYVGSSDGVTRQTNLAASRSPRTRQARPAASPGEIGPSTFSSPDGGVINRSTVNAGVPSGMAAMTSPMQGSGSSPSNFHPATSSTHRAHRTIGDRTPHADAAAKEFSGGNQPRQPPRVHLQQSGGLVHQGPLTGESSKSDAGTPKSQAGSRVLPIPAALAEGPTAPDNIHLSTLAAKQRANAERKEQRARKNRCDSIYS